MDQLIIPAGVARMSLVKNVLYSDEEIISQMSGFEDVPSEDDWEGKGKSVPTVSYMWAGC